jgi:cyclopropane fatty-acyl-phospholipid synthase-like methyltransferase
LRRPNVRRALAILRQQIVGVAEDFWKDGDWGKSANAPLPAGVRVPKAKPEVYRPEPEASKLWHAAPGEVSEKMWGTGCLTPAEDYFTDLLIKPLNLTKDLSVLDLAAGLGARMRRATRQYGVYVTGREPDPAIAARGMAISIAQGRGKKDVITPYDPMNFAETQKYDCIICRETMYRVADRQKFIASITACCKPRAQVSFTDYIVNPESKDQPAIVAWKAFEQDADPAGLVEMAELWAKAGISLRVHDDQTDYYKREVKEGLLRFTKFLASSAKPDEETKKAIEKRIQIWAHRMAAMEEGMRFYRFYGQK